MILLDYSSVMMSSLMVRINDYKDDTDLIRHLIMNQIRRYNLEFREEFGEMILCMDHTKNWRKETFPQYKANRRKGRKDDDKNWTEIFEMLNEIREDISKRSPFKVIRVEGCEADDVIGTICETNNNPEPILIISPDKDFVQLQRYPNVRQYSNLQKKWVEPDVDAVTDLQLKVLQGDTGDGVPNVLSPDNVFVDGEKQGRLTKQKKESLLENPESLGTTVARNIIRNRNMIDLTRTPQHLKDEIVEQYNKKANGSIVTLMSYFTSHRMNLLMESLPDFEVKFLNE